MSSGTKADALPVACDALQLAPMDAKVGDVRHAVAQHIHALDTMSKKRRNAIMALTGIDNGTLLGRWLLGARIEVHTKEGVQIDYVVTGDSL